MIFDKYVFKENERFYIDLNDSISEIYLDVGDNIKFSYENIKYFAKVIREVDKIYELCIIY
jgi:hypothetical protein